MTLPAEREEWDLSSIGLRLKDPSLPYERFEELCFMLGAMHGAVRFAIGDALIQGEVLYGEESFQAFEALGLSEDGKREYRRVSDRVPLGIRRAAVSWSHHRAIAPLPPPEQEAWLDRIETEGLSHHALRDELRNGSEVQSLQTCRCCGRAL